MESWKPSGPTCKDCLSTLEENKSAFTTTNCGTTMITPNGHSTPLKNPQNLTTGCNGNLLVKNGQNKTHIIKSSHINNGQAKNGGQAKNPEKTNHHLDLVKDSLCCCFKQSAQQSSSSVSKKPSDEDSSQENEYSCGFYSMAPRFLQGWANKKMFLAVFCLTSVLQGMYYTYFVSVLTTIEKLYQIQSKTTGIIMSATEIGQIGGALLLTYYGGHGHRPKWIACGMLVFAAASIFCATPHFLYSDMMEPAKAASAENATAVALMELRSKLCHNKFALKNDSSRTSVKSFLEDISEYESWVNDSRSTPATGAAESGANSTSPSLPLPEAWTRKRDICEDKHQRSMHNQTTTTVLCIFFFSLLLIGIGATAVYTLGIPYIDDNVATRESPLYFGITIGVRIFGPVFGFLLGSFCTSIHVNFPFETTDLTTDNPQWLGAWWLGVLIVGGALILTSFPMMAFPRSLRKLCKHSNQSSPKKFNHNHNDISEGKLLKCNGNVPAIANGDCSACQLCHPNDYYAEKNENTEKPKIKDFPSAISRLLKNDILLLRTASSVLHILPIAGLYTFLPKYLESQFQLTATMANMISGIAGILVMGIGIFASGSFMRRYKPDARFVARWIALSALLYAVGMIVLMMFGCPLNTYVGLNAGGDYGDQSSVINASALCNATCDCNPGEFAPICTSEGVTYLSPCLAGCTEVSGSSYEEYTYENCLCLGPNVTAVNGFCPLECSSLLPYIFVFALFVLVHSTSEVGSMLLTLRCVEPRDKAMALGLISFAIGLFGNVPCPIIYGAVVDSACLFWEDNCGEPGACRLYDPSKFRAVFHGVTAVIMLLAFCVDCVVWYKAKSIQFEEDEPSGDEEETIPFNEAPSLPQHESSV